MQISPILSWALGELSRDPWWRKIVFIFLRITLRPSSLFTSTMQATAFAFTMILPRVSLPATTSVADDVAAGGVKLRGKQRHMRCSIEGLQISGERHTTFPPLLEFLFIMEFHLFHDIQVGRQEMMFAPISLPSGSTEYC